MSETNGRVTPIKTTSETDHQRDDNSIFGSGNNQDSSLDHGVDLSKIAIIVSLLSVVLTVIFFFGLNRNLSGLSNEVRDIGVIRNNVAALDDYVDELLIHSRRVNVQIAELKEDRKTEAVFVLQQAMIDDMLAKAALMGEQLEAIESEDVDRAEKLSQLRSLLMELKAPAGAVDAQAEQAVGSTVEQSDAPPPSAGQGAETPPSTEQSHPDEPTPAPDPEPVLQ